MTEKILFTPHARGSTAKNLPKTFAERVYPACAGIDLCLRFSRSHLIRLPRMRGDRPWA